MERAKDAIPMKSQQYHCQSKTHIMMMSVDMPMQMRKISQDTTLR